MPISNGQKLRFVPGVGFVPVIPARELEVGMRHVSARHGEREIESIELRPGDGQLRDAVRIGYKFLGSSLYLLGSPVPVRLPSTHWFDTDRIRLTAKGRMAARKTRAA